MHFIKIQFLKWTFSALVLSAVTANIYFQNTGCRHAFYKYRLFTGHCQTCRKIPARPVKYRPSGNPIKMGRQLWQTQLLTDILHRPWSRCSFHERWPNRVYDSNHQSLRANNCLLVSESIILNKSHELQYSMKYFRPVHAQHVVSSRNYFFHHFCSKLNLETRNSSNSRWLFTSLVYHTYLKKSNTWSERQKLLLNMLRKKCVHHRINISYCVCYVKIGRWAL